MAIYTGVNGTNKEIQEMYVGVNGTNRKLNSFQVGVDGVNKELLETKLEEIVILDGANSIETPLGTPKSGEYWSLYSAYMNYYTRKTTHLGIPCWETSGTRSSNQITSYVVMPNIKVDVTKYKFLNLRVSSRLNTGSTLYTRFEFVDGIGTSRVNTTGNFTQMTPISQNTGWVDRRINLSQFRTPNGSSEGYLFIELNYSANDSLYITRMSLTAD